jgi:hypothetical protein
MPIVQCSVRTPPLLMAGNNSTLLTKAEYVHAKTIFGKPWKQADDQFRKEYDSAVRASSKNAVNADADAGVDDDTDCPDPDSADDGDDEAEEEEEEEERAHSMLFPPCSARGNCSRFGAFVCAVGHGVNSTMCRWVKSDAKAHGFKRSKSQSKKKAAADAAAADEKETDANSVEGHSCLSVWRVRSSRDDDGNVGAHRYAILGHAHLQPYRCIVVRLESNPLILLIQTCGHPPHPSWIDRFGFAMLFESLLNVFCNITIIYKLPTKQIQTCRLGRVCFDRLKFQICHFTINYFILLYLLLL